MKAPSTSFLIFRALLVASPVLPARADGFLHTEGWNLVDQKGHKLLLQSVGLGNWLLPEGYMWNFGDQADRPRKIEKLVADLVGPDRAGHFWSEFREQYIAEADIQRIAQSGFNAVRPALNARLFLTEGDGAAFCAEGFNLLERLVASCKKHHLYVIIDMHAAPGGQTGANIDDSPNDQPGLFIDLKNQERLINLWVELARRYKEEPTVAAYDLLNEPLPQRTGAAPKYKAQLEPLYQRITQAIRQVDPKHVITLEGADWANDWSVFSRPFATNLLYQFHYYCWDRPAHLNSITRFLDLRASLNAPIWAGETGERDNAIYWATTQYFEANNVGWSFWPWKKMAAENAPCSIPSPEGWSQITAFSRGGPKPSQEFAQKVFDQLLKNIRLENCEFHPDVVDALFHRVPGRVEAENYGHAGPGQSFVLKTPGQPSKYYRTAEPVPVEPIDTGGNRWRSQQAIKLGAGEWTAYTVTSLAKKSCAATIRARTEMLPAAFQFSAGSQAETVTLTQTNWAELKLRPVLAARGTNQLKLRTTQGVVSFDWLEFR